ncbi:MAG TPA: hypothetical protein VIJ51_07420 [Solirubrobacteraceae bacterium]
MSPSSLVKEVGALELSLEGLIKLLGEGPDGRERFIGILKGLTTPQRLTVVEQEIAATTREIATTTSNLSALHHEATHIQPGVLAAG